MYQEDPEAIWLPSMDQKEDQAAGMDSNPDLMRGREEFLMV